VVFKSLQLTEITISDGGQISFEDTGAIEFGNAAGPTRTNLGLPLAALTSTSNATFQEAVFTTNSAPTNGANFGDRVGWMGVSMVTNGVTNVFRIPIYK
jgi:cytochrome c oxidase assembly factor CtaG